MAELTKLESKLAEVIGLAMAAQDATKKVMKMVDDEELKAQLQTMSEEAAMAERESTEFAGTLQGKKAAIMREARTTKKKAGALMSDYLEKDSDGLDGFEFLTMAEAGELGHWNVLVEMNKKAKNRQLRELTGKVVAIQKRHLRDTHVGTQKLAGQEDPNEAG